MTTTQNKAGMYKEQYQFFMSRSSECIKKADVIEQRLKDPSFGEGLSEEAKRNLFRKLADEAIILLDEALEYNQEAEQYAHLNFREAIDYLANFALGMFKDKKS